MTTGQTGCISIMKINAGIIMRYFNIFILFVFLTGCTSIQFTTEEVKKELQQEKIGTSRFVKIGEHTLHYLEDGRGEPMILIHGWICWGAYWKKIIPRVRDRHHIYAPDLLGHGISDKPLDKNCSYGTDAQADRIIAFMDALSIKKAYLVGHSMGGEIAAKITLKAPGRVKGLVLICAAGMEENPRLLPGFLRFARSLKMEGLAADMLDEGMIRRHVPDLMFYKENPMPDEFVKDIMMSNLKSKEDRKAIAKVTREGLFRNFLDKRCAEIKTPTLIISAKYDRVVPPSMGERYHALIADSKFILIDRAAHMAPWEQAEQVAASIHQFCR